MSSHNYFRIPEGRADIEKGQAPDRGDEAATTVKPDPSDAQSLQGEEKAATVSSGPPCCGGEHFVQFYERDEALVKSLAEFVIEGQDAGEAVVLIATPEHLESLEEQLRERSFEPDLLAKAGAYLALDAGDTLAAFMAGDSPDEQLFAGVVEPVLARAGAGGRRVRAFGEMVALLWAEGNQRAAIRLEELWNELGRRHCFSLFCAYPMQSFAGAANEELLFQVCNAHGRIVPAESYSERGTSQEQATAITLLQQKAASLEAEMAGRQSAEKSLRANQKVVSELEAFSFTISHDLRAPLRAIRGYVQVMLEDHGHQLPEEAVDYLRRIAASGERMDHLIQDVLDFSRSTAPGFCLEPVDLGQLVRGIIDCRTGLQPPQATVCLQEPLPVLLANRSAVTQCLSNLLDNAVKFVAPGTHPVVHISAERLDAPAERVSAGAGPGGWVRICIRDNGIGLPEGAQSKIFGLFQRGQTGYEGTGIGLATVKKAAERMGGRVGCRSHPEGGSLFWVDLQVAQD